MAAAPTRSAPRRSRHNPALRAAQPLWAPIAHLRPLRRAGMRGNKGVTLIANDLVHARISGRVMRKMRVDSLAELVRVAAALGVPLVAHR